MATRIRRKWIGCIGNTNLLVDSMSGGKANLTALPMTKPSNEWQQHFTYDQGTGADRATQNGGRK
jgi:hypothetical protein